MLFSIIPISFVFLAIWPDVGAPALLFVLRIVTLVRSTVLPGVKTSTMQLVILPLALVASAIWPVVGSNSIDSVVGPVSIVLCSICPLVGALPVLHAFFEETDVAAAVWKDFLALAMLEVVEPRALIVLTIAVSIDTVSVCLILDEGALKCVSVAVVEGALALHFVVCPLTDVLGSVSELLGSESVSDLTSSHNLARVD